MLFFCLCNLPKYLSSQPFLDVFQWNETIKLFRGGMPLRRHWAHFRSYDNSFTGSEAVDHLHELLRCNQNFGPEVTRYQSLQLLRKFLKNHVIEDVKGRFGKEDFDDNGRLYRCWAGLWCSVVFFFTLLTFSLSCQISSTVPPQACPSAHAFGTARLCCADTAMGWPRRHTSALSRSDEAACFGEGFWDWICWTCQISCRAWKTYTGLLF